MNVKTAIIYFVMVVMKITFFMNTKGKIALLLIYDEEILDDKEKVEFT